TAVACVEGAPLWERCRAAGIPVHALPAGSGLRAILGLRRICRAIDPVCLHAHTSRTHQLARLCAGSRPVLVSRRVSFPLRRRWTSAWKYGGVRHFVAVSDAARAGLLGIGIPAERITIISD